MNIRNLFSFVTLINLLFGLGLIFATQFMANQYLTNPDWVNPAATLMAQGWGVMLVAQGVACWVLRNDGLTTGAKAMLLQVVVQNIGWITIYSLAVTNGVETPMAWLQVVLSVVVGGWAAMLLRQSPSAIA